MCSKLRDCCPPELPRVGRNMAIDVDLTVGPGDPSSSFSLGPMTWILPWGECWSSPDRSERQPVLESACPWSTPWPEGDEDKFELG